MVLKTDENSFFKYIKAVGTGPKGNRDLSFNESKDMMQQILSQKVHPELVSAFLLGWRLKPETIEEFSGALSAMDEFTLKMEVPNSLELGYPFDGKAKNPYLFPLVSKIIEEQELNLVVVGDALQPAKNGITTQDICSKIKLHSKIHYFDRKNYSPQLYKLTEIRQRLALRSGINTLEKLTQLSRSSWAITGVHHKPYVEKYNAIFAHRYERFALIQGNEGSPELFQKGTLWLSENETTSEYIIDPSLYGVNLEKSTQKLSLEESLEMLQNPSRDLLTLAKLNGAIWLFVANKFPTINDAYDALE